jgi:hypothetical protein
LTSFLTNWLLALIDGKFLRRKEKLTGLEVIVFMYSKFMGFLDLWDGIMTKGLPTLNELLAFFRLKILFNQALRLRFRNDIILFSLFFFFLIMRESADLLALAKSSIFIDFL